MSNEVICINDSQIGYGNRPPVRVGDIYVVRGNNQCPCGRRTVDVGIRSSSAFRACSCGLRTPSDGTWWVAVSRFRPLDTLEQDIERIESEGCPEPELQEA